MNTNPLPKLGVYATPESFLVLEDFANGFHGPERALAFILIGMTRNWCHAEVQRHLDAEREAVIKTLGKVGLEAYKPAELKLLYKAATYDCLNPQDRETIWRWMFSHARPSDRTRMLMIAKKLQEQE